MSNTKKEIATKELMRACSGHLDNDPIPSYHPKKITVKLIKSLLEQGAEINYQDDRGNTPLINAAYEGLFSIVKCLVENGADIYLKDKFGHGAFFAAIIRQLRMTTWRKTLATTYDSYYNPWFQIVKYLAQQELIASSSNGRTPDFESGNVGSIPAEAANK